MTWDMWALLVLVGLAGAGLLVVREHTDFEQEPVDHWQGWCSIHEDYFYRTDGCKACGEMADERHHDELLDDRGLAS